MSEENMLPQEEVVPESTDPVEQTDELGEAGETQHKKQNGFQKRVAKLAQDRDFYRDEAEQLRQELAKFKTTTSSEPKLDDFESYNDWQDALVDYKAEQKAARKLEEAAHHKVMEGRVQEYQKSFKELEAKYEDFHDVLAMTNSEELFKSSDVQDFCLDAGAEFVYKLLQDEGQIERLEKMSPARRLAELGKLEDKFKSPKKTTSAPAKVSNLSGSAATGEKKAQDVAHDYTQWKIAREKELAAKRKR